MWYCPKCGTENDGRFCSACGREYENYDNMRYSFDEDYVPQKTKKGGKGPLIAIIIVAALLIIGSLVGVMVFMGNGDNSAEPVQGTGVIYYVSNSSGYAPLYDDHNIESAVLANLRNGSPVEYISSDNEVFYYVTDRGTNITGYILARDLVSSLDDVIVEEEKEIEKISLGDYYVTGADDKVAITDAPGSSNKVAYLYNGYHVALIEETSSSYWYIFDYKSGEFGYIKKGYLTDDPDKVVSGEAVDVKPAAPIDKTIVADYRVDGTKNYLAIRSYPSSSEDVEIGKTYNGNIVGLIEKTNGTFWYVYDYTSGLYGYVKCAYLDYMYDVYNNLGTEEYYVKGTKNYLAIRSYPSSSEDVEIGKTYNGNVVNVVEYTNNTYWYIYDYNSGLYGYVKCKYLSK